MATSGTFNTTGYYASDGTIYLAFSWNAVTQSLENNATTISWELRGGGTSRQGFVTKGISVKIAGSEVYSSGSSQVYLASGELVSSGSKTIPHADDGTGSFLVDVVGSIYNWGSNNAKGSATYTLETIARASQPSIITRPNTTQNIGDFGKVVSIYMNSKSSSFTHTVRYVFGTMSGTCINQESGGAATGIKTSIQWKIPEDFMNLLPNVNSGSGTIYVDTYSGGKLVGTKGVVFTATVPSSVAPTCSVSLEDVTGIQAAYGSPVKTLSKIKFKVNPTLAYSSPIDSYVVVINNVTYRKAEDTTGYLTSAGDVLVNVTVTDKRGRIGKTSHVMNVLDYAKPTISLLTVRRCNEDGTTNDQGNFVKVDYKADCTDLNGKNTETYTIGYKKSGESTYTTSTLSYAGNYAAGTYIFEANNISSYDVLFTAKDRHNTATRTTSASTAYSLMDWHSSGRGIAFGAMSEGEGFKCAMPAFFTGGVQGNNLMGRHVSDIGDYLVRNAGVSCLGSQSNAGLLLILDTANPGRYVLASYHYIANTSNTVTTISSKDMTCDYNVYGTVSARDSSGNSISTARYVVMPCFAL